MKLALTFVGKLFILLICWLTPVAADANLQLTEFMPDPAGDDSQEWIELYNNSQDEVSTEGWTLMVKTRSTPLSPRTLSPGQYLILTKAEANFTLTNTGATIALVDPAGTIATQLSYGQAPSEQSYAIINNLWQWTKTATPAGLNILSLDSTAAKTTQATLPPYPLTPINEITKLPSGAKITVEGLLVAAAEEINAKTAFLDGLQLNLTNGAWPALTVGDRIRVKGSVSHTQAYGNRLNVSSPETIAVLSHETLSEPTILAIKDITPEYEGKLIKTNGEVTTRGNNWFDLAQGEAELRIVLKNQDLNWPKRFYGSVEITGLITLSQGGLRLWPRSPNDILLSQAAVPGTTKTIDLTQPEPTDWRGYIILGLLVLLLGAGWWWQKQKLPSPVELIKTWYKNTSGNN